MNEIETTLFEDQQTGLTWISSARKSNTINPFIIYNFFNQLEELGDAPGNTFFVLFNTCMYIALLITMRYCFTV